MEKRDGKELEPVAYQNFLLSKLRRIDQLRFENDPRYLDEVYSLTTYFPPAIQEEFEEKVQNEIDINLDEITDTIDETGENITRPGERKQIKQNVTQSVSREIADELVNILTNVMYENNMIPTTNQLDSTMSSPGEIVE